jgi:hypothetical protein
MVRPGAILLPQLQAPRKDDAQGGAGQGRKDDKDKKKDDEGGGRKKGSPNDGDEAADKRHQAEQACLEQQAAAQAQAASAPAPAASVVSPSAPTDKAPAGIGSPAMTAPTQGQGGKPK